MSGNPPRHGLITFIETEVFRRAWKNSGLKDKELFGLQLEILEDPKGWPVMAETGGLRKMRFRPPGTQRGKSGAFRVLYVYFEEFGIVLLVTAYPKGKKDNLSPEGRKAARTMIKEQKKLLRGKALE